jgi:hypothetical protein
MEDFVECSTIAYALVGLETGCGDSIITGKDEILGMGKVSFLSTEMINRLNNKHVYFLFQVSRSSV